MLVKFGRLYNRFWLFPLECIVCHLIVSINKPAIKSNKHDSGWAMDYQYCKLQYHSGAIP